VGSQIAIPRAAMELEMTDLATRADISIVGALKARVSLALVALLTACLGPASADSVADFYRGKTLSMIIGTSPGNDYDNRARLLARYMGRHIPGQPTIVPRNMPGGGGIQATNYMANVAPQDGTVLYLLMQNMPVHQAIGGEGAKFDLRRFYWIGNTTDAPNVTAAWHTAGIDTIEDVKQKELIVGGPAGTAGVFYPTAMNVLVGTKFKVVTGYPGGNEVNLAMERGEINGRGSNSWASWKSTKPEWLADKKIKILVQIGLKRHPDLPDVPLMFELAKNQDDRAVLTFLSADTALSRSLVTTPGTPLERVSALRRAFDATMKDPDFLADADKAKIDISPSTGEDTQKVAQSILDAPPGIISKAKEILESTSK
jgi:tripartite-type tricarboxylate transporter receptor subunit TctC